jgi:hypothetical protein
VDDAGVVLVAAVGGVLVQICGVTSGLREGRDGA